MDRRDGLSYYLEQKLGDHAAHFTMIAIWNGRVLNIRAWMLTRGRYIARMGTPTICVSPESAWGRQVEFSMQYERRSKFMVIHGN